MQKIILFSVLATVAGATAAQEVGRVLSSTPVVQQIAVPRQVCSNTPVAVQGPKSGGGALLGAIAGGAAGNAVGDGGGRAIATMIGLVGGAMLGDRIEGGGGTQVQNVQQCGNQTFYENRTVAYNVVYEYAGRQYNVQMPQDPGPTVQVQVTPVGSLPQPPLPQVSGNNGYYPPDNNRYYQEPVAAPYPIYQPQPGYYARPYYPPIGVSLNLGFSNSRGYGHRHWR